MKYALHASLHRPARRPDQTASRPGGVAVDGATPEPASEPSIEAGAANPSAARLSLLPDPIPATGSTLPASLAEPLPPPPAVAGHGGRPSFLSTPLPTVVTAHDRPTLRFPAVPPPASLPASDAAPVVSAREQITEQILVQDPTPIIDINEPTLEEAPVRVEDFAEENEDRQPAKPRIARARKKGTPAPLHAAPVAAPVEHHQMPEIDPAAWLADEAHARSSDRRDSADGVDNSDTVVPVPRPTHYA